MYPNCEHVEYAITFLISFWTKPTLAANNAVKPPIRVTQTKTVGANSNKGEDLIKTKTPAVTIVAAWIRAETGVGVLFDKL